MHIEVATTKNDMYVIEDVLEISYEGDTVVFQRDSGGAVVFFKQHIVGYEIINEELKENA